MADYVNIWDWYATPERIKADRHPEAPVPATVWDCYTRDSSSGAIGLGEAHALARGAWRTVCGRHLVIEGIAPPWPPPDARLCDRCRRASGLTLETDLDERSSVVSG